MSSEKLSRGEIRRQKILQVAEEMFMQNGYAGTSVNEVVKQAGGSLNTLYRYFGNKLGLFEAVFQSKTDALFSPFLSCDYWQDDLATNLTKFGEALQQIVFSPAGIAINRLVMAENNQEQQEIHRIFLQYGPQNAIQILSKYLCYEQEKGNLKLAHTELAAAQFLEMVKGPFYYRVMFGESLSEAELKQGLAQEVQLFLQGCSTAPKR